MPLALLAAPPETEVLVHGDGDARESGQIAELCEIAEPDVAAITNVGPVHLELLGTLEAIVEAKAEILRGLRAGGRAVVPADAEALEPHLGDDLEVVTFGPGGDVFARRDRPREAPDAATIVPRRRGRVRVRASRGAQPLNAVCAVAIGVALGRGPGEMARRTSRIEFSRLRGERVALRGRILLLNDCYNANPISMRAAIENWRRRSPDGAAAARVAVLGGMAELGPDGPEFHARDRRPGPWAGDRTAVGVGELARDYSPDEWVADADEAVDVVAAQLRPGDVALVKGSRSVGLERLTDGLRARFGEAAE